MVNLWAIPMEQKPCSRLRRSTALPYLTTDSLPTRVGGRYRLALVRPADARPGSCMLETLVELSGIEPLTSSLRTTRSPN